MSTGLAQLFNVFVDARPKDRFSGQSSGLLNAEVIDMQLLENVFSHCFRDEDLLAFKDDASLDGEFITVTPEVTCWYWD